MACINHIKLRISAAFTFMLALSFGFAAAQTLQISIKNIRTPKGKLVVAIFDNQESFKKRKPIYHQNVDKQSMKNGTVHVEIPFKSGNFGIAVLDDANANGKMDYRMLGIPTEGFGFSDFVSKGMKNPHFSDFSFRLNENELKNIHVLLRYITK